jgi:general secretion pathway protein G
MSVDKALAVAWLALFLNGCASTAEKLDENAERARVTSAKIAIRNFSTELTSYKLDTDTYPTTAQGLQALRANPGNVPHWAGPYQKDDVPNDPWGHPYVYKFPGEHGDEPDILSYGPDGKAGGDGVNADIGSWQLQ